MGRDTTNGAATISRWFAGGAQERYQAYSYSYPHKTAYREFSSPVSLRDLWSGEKRDALFLYLHIPFCEMRCGFCNLFTTTNPDISFESAYLDALERQCIATAESLGDARFARMALGGGTPTYLDARDLERVFDMVERAFHATPMQAPCSVETSPYTSDLDKLRVLKERGVERVSIGIQSFIESEVRAIGRTQDSNVVRQALERIKQFDFDTLNIDLMYGLPGQTFETWSQSLIETVKYAPQQVYLYPLYIRPLTGMGRKGAGSETVDIRVDLYRQARQFLIQNGYEQSSMRMFERSTLTRPVYCCQDDGMIGVGCGARSYTSTHHYSMKYAVGQKPVREILETYVNAPADSFLRADYGFVLNQAEQTRRFLIQSLLQIEGLVFEDYERRFGSDVRKDYAKELNDLTELGLIWNDGIRLRMTEAGLEWSDRIGFELYSEQVKKQMVAYEGD